MASESGRRERSLTRAERPGRPTIANEDKPEPRPGIRGDRRLFSVAQAQEVALVNIQSHDLFKQLVQSLGKTCRSGSSSVTRIVYPGKHERKWSRDRKVSLKSKPRMMSCSQSGTTHSVFIKFLMVSNTACKRGGGMRSVRPDEHPSGGGEL
ncbi:hypothetical protein EYF80_050763 [Liparis tanakae]|uniref:Uncharacterized protein n=1 Tax=Liparis tanakae TaxID=230148 RepID=A0A4Z2FDL8_9TELE|nr:hypothetical protein EYF80_050763 [Liparis tanakae]